MTLPATFLALFLSCGFAAGTPDGPVPVAERADVGKTDAAGLKNAIAAGPVVLVDVRTAGEWNRGHVAGALHIPIDELEGRLSELEPHKKADVYLMCAAGVRSGRGAALLSAHGFTRPINVTDGARGWEAAGYPLVTGE